MSEDEIESTEEPGEESTTTDPSDEEKPPKKIIKTSKTVQDDYKAMVKILQNQTGIKDKALEGMTWKEKFDKLSFYAEHQPKITKNQKIVPESPSGIASHNHEGIEIIDNPITGKKSYTIDPVKLFNQSKNN